MIGLIVGAIVFVVTFASRLSSVEVAVINDKAQMVEVRSDVADGQKKIAVMSKQLDTIETGVCRINTILDKVTIHAIEREK